MSVYMRMYWLFKVIALCFGAVGIWALAQVSVYAVVGVTLISIFHIFDALGEEAFKDHLQEKRSHAASSLLSNKEA
jgi:fatty acid desaturase